MFNPRYFFPIYFSFVYLLAALRLSTQISEFENITHFIVILSIISFILGTLFIKSNNIVYNYNKIYSFTINKKLLHISFIISFLSMSLLSMEYYMTNIPIFNDIEIDRLNVQTSGYVHLLAMSFKPILSIYIAIYFIKKDLNLKKIDLYILFVLIITGTTLLIFSGSRGHIFLVVVVSFLFLILYKNIKIFYILIGSLLLLLLMGYAKYYRDFLFFGDTYVDSLASVWLFEYDYLFFYNTYMSLAMNFNIFDKLVATFYIEDFAYGYYLLLPIISLWPGSQPTLGDWQNEVWSTGFHGALTSTYLGIPYADFGVLGIFLIPFVFGLISMYFYKNMVNRLTFSAIIQYSYWTVLLLFTIYTYPFAKLSSFIFIIIFILFSHIIKTKEKNENIILRKT